MGTLSGWAFRKAITIAHTADGAQTNYQMKVTLVKGAGADSAGVIYLGNHCLNWPTDILFTLSDGTTTAGADFWREESDATDGTWWLEANSIPAHPDDWTGYMYYGKVDAADTSSGENTFLLFDHFDGDLALWTTVGTPSVSSSICQLLVAGGVAQDIISKTSFPINRFMRCLVKSKHNNTSYSEGIGFSKTNYELGARPSNPTYANKYLTYQAAGPTTTTIPNWLTDTYLTLDILRNGTTNVKFSARDASVVTHTTYLCEAQSMSVGFDASVQNNSEIDINWVVVGVCTLNPPTWGATGAEEKLAFIPYENPIFQLLVR
jgi:hypothetical protein